MSTPAEESEPVSTAENPLPCPVPSPDGLPCRKRIPVGWKASEGHGGGHMWMSERTGAIFDGGHYDATGALSGLPFRGHLPQECPDPQTCEFLRYR